MFITRKLCAKPVNNWLPLNKLSLMLCYHLSVLCALNFHLSPEAAILLVSIWRVVEGAIIVGADRNDRGFLCTTNDSPIHLVALSMNATILTFNLLPTVFVPFYQRLKNEWFWKVLIWSQKILLFIQPFLLFLKPIRMDPATDIAHSLTQ